jgi:hypothetical protein
LLRGMAPFGPLYFRSAMLQPFACFLGFLIDRVGVFRPLVSCPRYRFPLIVLAQGVAVTRQFFEKRRQRWSI